MKSLFRPNFAAALPAMRWRMPRWPLVSCVRHASRPTASSALGRMALATTLSLLVSPAIALDVNVASAEQLEGIRGLGPRTAQIIVRERERGGKFESLEDLSDRVRGIGVKKAQALHAAGMTVGGAKTAEIGAIGPKTAVKATPETSGKAPSKTPTRPVASNLGTVSTTGVPKPATPVRGGTQASGRN